MLGILARLHCASERLLASTRERLLIAGGSDHGGHLRVQARRSGVVPRSHGRRCTCVSCATSGAWLHVKHPSRVDRPARAAHRPPPRVRALTKQMLDTPAPARRRSPALPVRPRDYTIHRHRATQRSSVRMSPNRPAAAGPILVVQVTAQSRTSLSCFRVLRRPWFRRNVRPPTSANSPAYGRMEAQHVARIAFCR